MRYGVRALAAVYQATVPWCSILIRRAYGVAAAGHQHMGRFNFRYAWPSANWGSLPIEGGLEVAYKAEIEGADDPVQKRAEIEQRVRSLKIGRARLNSSHSQISYAVFCLKKK